MAPFTALKELRFFTSTTGVLTTVPSSSSMITLMLGSNRMWPFCMMPSVTPRNRQTLRSSCAKATTSAAESKSGAVTISRSGVPARLRSTSDPS